MKFIVIFIVFITKLLAFEPIIILVGPPGSGKGTFSQYLKENHNYNHVCVGDILRSEIESQTELGREIKETVQKGDYIDPKIIRMLLAKNIAKFKSVQQPLILDGFGQNEGDMQAIKNILEEVGLISRTFLVHLNASDDVCCNRMSNRSICMRCGHVYNSLNIKPVKLDRCDLCGEKLQTKINDSPEVIVKRLQYYRESIEKFYQDSLFLFPSISFNTDRSCDDCVLFYERIAQEAAKCETDASNFITKIY